MCKFALSLAHIEIVRPPRRCPSTCDSLRREYRHLCPISDCLHVSGFYRSKVDCQRTRILARTERSRSIFPHSQLRRPTTAVPTTASSVRVMISRSLASQHTGLTGHFTRSSSSVTLLDHRRRLDRHRRHTRVLPSHDCHRELEHPVHGELDHTSTKRAPELDLCASVVSVRVRQLGKVDPTSVQSSPSIPTKSVVPFVLFPPVSLSVVL